MKETQKHKILKLLMEHQGKWVPLSRIRDLYVMQYNTRIKELRDSGIRIINRPASCLVPGDVIAWEGKPPINLPRNMTYFTLITPKNLIDYESLTVKQGQGVLNVY